MRVLERDGGHKNLPSLVPVAPSDFTALPCLQLPFRSGDLAAAKESRARFRNVMVTVGTGARAVSTHFGPDFDVSAETIERLAKYARQELVDDNADVTVTWRVLEVDRASLKALRGADAGRSSKLRLWEKADVAPRPDDLFQERLYAILWMTKDTVDKSRPTTFFASVTTADLRREVEILDLVQTNLAQWQAAGFVPDMPIDPGPKTSEPVRTRGWTHWHHLFTPTRK
ncbi:hypothetical protein [Sphingobium chungbukense]|uniref:hypothetical protein n=1 Tax=Sphingobium chungbukense TaxID=56193 RepID=UPI0018DD6E1F|nr:hypothetical protein [Sphingobium chungbukense]